MFYICAGKYYPNYKRILYCKLLYNSIVVSTELHIIVKQNKEHKEYNFHFLLAYCD